MRRISKLSKNDFKKASDNELESYYDIFEDWDLIASSLKKQYGYSIRKEIDNLNWGELSSDIAGLLPDTPLRKCSSNSKRK